MLGKRSVAVLPFKLLTPNPEDEYLGVALADAIINQLGGSGEVLVRPINTVRRYAKQAVDPLLAAREMNVHIVVDGSIQKSGLRLRVHVQAWNAADGTTLLSGKYDSEMAALFELQDQVAEALARALDLKTLVRLNRQLRLRRKTRGPTNYFCVRSNACLASTNGTCAPPSKCWRTRRGSILDFGDAWARLAEACVFMAGTFDPTPKWYKKGEVAMRRALALGSHQCAGSLRAWQSSLDTAQGIQEPPSVAGILESLRRSPGYHPALVWQCLIFLHVGMMQEAIDGFTYGACHASR